MGHINQALFIQHHVPRDGTRKVIEIGSKDYGSTIPWRSYFKDAEYIGVDLEAGKNVDVVADITQGTAGLPSDADMVICCSLLEHVRKPWIAAKHIESLLAPGGLLYIAVPWVWRYHPYPDDYYRFSFNGIRELFDGIEWDMQAYSTNVKGQFLEAKDGADNSMAHVVDDTKFLPYLEVHSLGRKRGD